MNWIDAVRITLQLLQVIDYCCIPVVLQWYWQVGECLFGITIVRKVSPAQLLASDVKSRH